MRTLLLALATSVAIGTPASPDSATASPSLTPDFGNMPLLLERNEGQFDEQVSFAGRGAGYQLFLTKSADAVLVFRAAAEDGEGAPETAVIRMSLKDASNQPVAAAEQEAATKIHYMKGAADQWRTAATYGAARFRGVYDGIDLVYYGNQQRLQYDFVVAPGSDPSVIALSFEGVEKLEVDADGELLLHTPLGTLRQKAPYTYQKIDGEKREVASAFRLAGDGTVGFDVGGHDPAHPLVIDPILTYVTVAGGSAADDLQAVAAAPDGGLYFAGRTDSTDFPVANPLAPTAWGGTDVLVGKLNAAGTALEFATYLGGRFDDTALAMATDSTGNIYITGMTDSTDDPVTPLYEGFPFANAYQPSHSGAMYGAEPVPHAYLAKLNPQGNTLLYSTYYGASHLAVGSGVAADDSGNAYITGTVWAGLPSLPARNGYKTSPPIGSEDAFLAHFDTNASGDASLVYSTFFGGSAADSGVDIAISGGAVYVMGDTVSQDLPVRNPYQSTYGGNEEGFVAKFNTAASGDASLLYSTYFGGTQYDAFKAMAVVGSHVILTGGTKSPDFPVKHGFQASLAGGGGFFGPADAVLARFDTAVAGAGALIYSTLHAGTGGAHGYSIIALDDSLMAVTGITSSNDFPLTNAFQNVNAGDSDAYVAIYDTSAIGEASRVFSTYLGGPQFDIGRGIAVDSGGNLLVGGFTRSGTLAGVTPAGIGPRGEGDIFFAKIDLTAPDTQPPVIAVIDPEHNSAINQLATLSGTATDPGGSGIAGDVVNIRLRHLATDDYWQGGTWGTDATYLVVSVNPETGTWTRNSGLPNADNDTLRDGEYQVDVTTGDNAGNQTPIEEGINDIRFIVDRQPPEVTITSPEDDTTITEQIFSFEGTAADDNGIDRVIVRFRRNSDGQYWNGSGWVDVADPANPVEADITTSYSAETEEWSCTANRPVPGYPPNNMPNGSYTFFAIAIDHAGNPTPAESEVTVDYHPVYTWTGATLQDDDPYNNSNSWDMAANWSPNGVPGAEDIAIIGNGDSVNTTISRSVYGLQLSAGTLNINGTLTTTHSIAWTGGTLTGTWENQGTATLSGPEAKVLGDYSVVNNYGTIIWEGGGLLQAWAQYGSSTINNKNDGSFRIAADGEVFGRVNTTYRPVFYNENGALFEKQSGVGTSTLTVWEYRNAGEIRCGTGTLAFVDAPYNIDLYLDPGTTLTGSGILRLQTDTQLSTAVHASCPVHLPEGGSLSCTALSRFEGTLHWTGGTIYGVLAIGPDGVVNLSDAIPETPTPKVLGDYTTLNNEGTINWLGGGALQAWAQYGGATVNNLPGGEFNIMADGTPFDRANATYRPVFINENGALLEKQSGVGTSTLTVWEYRNAGEIRCGTGTLAFVDAPYNIDLYLDPGTTLTGSGILRLQTDTQLSTAVHALCPVHLPEGGSFSCTALSRFEGTLHWTGGTIYGVLAIGPDGVVNLSDAVPETPTPKVLGDYTTLNNEGTINWLGGGALQAMAQYGDATVNNLPGGEFNIMADGTPFDRANTTYVPVFNNAFGAKFSRAEGSETATIHTYTFNNEGEIAVETGILNFNTTLNLKSGGALGGAGFFEMSGGIVNVTGTTSLTGTSFSVLAGTIAGVADAVWTSSSGGAWRWLGGNLSGTLEMGVGSTLQISDPPSGPSVKLFSNYAVLNNKGIVSWSGAGELRAEANYGSSTVNNRSGGQFQVTADGVLLSREHGTYLPEFNNEEGALFEKPTGDPGVASTCDWRFNNGGVMQIGGGKVELLQGGDSSGTFSSDAGAFLRFCGGSHTVRDGTIFNGTGRIQVDGGTLLGDGVLNGNTASPGAFELLTGTLGGTTNYTGSGLFHWEGGTVAGTLTMAALSRCEIDGVAAKVLADYSVVNNYGTIIWEGGGSLQAWAQYGSSTINNKTDGSFRIAADGEVFGRVNATYRPVFYNENGALLEKQSGVGTSTLTVWEYRNAGEIRCGTGTLAFVDAPYNIDLYLDPGTTLTGTGILRLQTDTQLSTAVHASCPVHLPEGGSLGCTALSRFEGTLHWTGGTIYGVLAIGPDGVVNISDAVLETPTPKVLGDNTTLNNEGAINWLGGGALQAMAQYGDATVNNLSGGQFHAAADGTVFDRVNPTYVPVFNNSGSFRIGASPGLCIMSGWNFIQSSTGALNIEVAGPSLTEFDRLNLTSGGITLGGSLHVSKLNGYEPGVGTTFEFLTSSGLTGTFSHIYAPDFAVDYTAGGATLRVVEAGMSFDDWALAINLTGPNSLLGDDFDGDGQTNFAEYVFNTDPKSGNAAPDSSTIETINGQKWLTLNYRRWEDREAAGVVYTPEGSQTLEIWDGIGVIDEDDLGAPIIPGSLARRCRIPIGGEKQFLHIKAHN